jgi:hypothetical protein
MATKKTRKKQTKLKKTAAKRKPMKKTAKKKLAAKKKAAPRKKLAKKMAAPKAKRKLTVKKPAAKKPAVKTRPVGNKTTGAKAAGDSQKRVQGKGQSVNIESFAPEEVRARSAGQSGDLQGLSNIASADSESVDELVEEGNAFEAEVVSGVEAADRGDEEEVHTHEVPEDDVPDEYLDKE